MPPPGPLAGLSVLDLASVGPAARASGWLADYGADVVKVAPLPQLEQAASVAPPHAYSGGRGTRRVRIDLKNPAGRGLFLRLAETTDVVLESFRPGVVARLGIGYDDVKARNPGVIYCATTGYGQQGPRAGWAGHDLNYLAVSGFLAAGEAAAGGKPALPGATVADSAGGGLHALAAILAALLARGRSGEGAYLDVCVADGMLALMSLALDDFLATGQSRRPGAAPLQDRFACYEVYPTADGGWLAVAALEPRFWANLCHALGLGHWVERQYDPAAQDSIRAELAAALLRRPRDAWVSELAGADTCVAPVLSVAEAAGQAPQASLPGRGHQQLAPLLAGAARAGCYRLPDPQHSDTDEVLAAVGLDAAQVRALHAAGVVA